MASKSIFGLHFVFLAEMWIQFNAIRSDGVNNDVLSWFYSDRAHCWLRLCTWKQFPWELACQITNWVATKHLHAVLIHWSMAQTQPSDSHFSSSSSLWGLNPGSEEMDQQQETWLYPQIPTQTMSEWPYSLTASSGPKLAMPSFSVLMY